MAGSLIGLSACASSEQPTIHGEGDVPHQDPFPEPAPEAATTVADEDKDEYCWLQHLADNCKDTNGNLMCRFRTLPKKNDDETEDEYKWRMLRLIRDEDIKPSNSSEKYVLNKITKDGEKDPKP